MLPHLDAVRAGVGQCHPSDVEFAVAALAADLEALGRQDDGGALVPADAAAGVGHGAVQHHSTLLHCGLVLQWLDDADWQLWRSVKQRAGLDLRRDTGQTSCCTSRTPSTSRQATDSTCLATNLISPESSGRALHMRRKCLVPEKNGKQKNV